MSQQDPSPTNQDNRHSVTHSQATATKILAALQTSSVRVLRSTSQLLERTATSLEAQSVERPNPTIAKLLEQSANLWERGVSFWRKLLSQIRTRLPQNLNEKFSDRTLGGIVTGVAIVLLWFTSNLFSEKPPQPTQIAQRPEIKLPAPKSFPPELSAPAAPEVLPSPVPVIAPTPEVESPVVEEPIAEEPIAEEPVTVAPSPEPVVVPSPEPKIELTPEQQRLASIQTEISEVGDRFINGLVASVQPQNQRLTVKVSEDWYRFNPEQQNRVANELWQRSQTLDFSKFRITDANGVILARPPVVGSEMVILKRKPAIA